MASSDLTGRSEYSIATRSQASPAAVACRICGCQKPATDEHFHAKQLKKLAKCGFVVRGGCAYGEPSSSSSCAALCCLICSTRIKTEEHVQLHAVRVRTDTGLVVEAPSSEEADLEGGILWVSDPVCVAKHLTGGPFHGIRYYPNFLSEEDEKRIMSVIECNRWSDVFQRRQQFYGEVYFHTQGVVGAVQPKYRDTAKDSDCRGGFQQEVLTNSTHVSFDPSQNPDKPAAEAFSLDDNFGWLIDKLRVFEQEKGIGWFSRKDVDVEKICDDSGSGSCVARGSSFPSQILVNEYRSTTGISSHFEDFGAFGEEIITVSLLQPIYMTLEKPRTARSNDCDDIVASSKILLEPRSLFVMQGPSRTDFRHCITRHADVHLPSGEKVKRDENYRRVSLTIRHLLDGRKQVGVG